MQEKFFKLAAAGNPVEPEMNPADQAPAATPGAGENVCPKCGGSGITDNDAMPCEHCGGTGKAIEGVVPA